MKGFITFCSLCFVFLFGEFMLRGVLPTDEPLISYDKNFKGTKILYISNSHARTGGYVSRHLQQLLDQLTPNQYQVLDISDPGIFTPDMHQRFARTLKWKPDVLVLPVAYISFSDRMQLRRQSFTARSFFDPDVFPHLDIGFWFRNYDIGLFLDEVVKRFSKLLSNRNEVRDLWEQPLADSLRGVFGEEPIRFLEVDEKRGWEFPEGFDRNLFQWNLYALGRDGHIGDLRALLKLAKKRDVKVLGANLPIHFTKDPHVSDPADVALFRKEVKESFGSEEEFIDYQDSFPKEFSTYDALHPTWHGARLHAFDILLRLVASGIVNVPDDNLLLDNLKSSGEKDLLEYREILALEETFPHSGSFRRFDLFESPNAKDLIDRAALKKVGSAEEKKFLLDLVSRIEYWEKVSFKCSHTVPAEYSDIWMEACSSEVAQSKERIAIFKDALGKNQQQKLSEYSIPEYKTDSASTDKKELSVNAPSGKVHFLQSEYQLSGGERIFEYSMKETGVPFAVVVANGKQVYLRLDILCDGSFALLDDPNNFAIPQCFLPGIPDHNWGA